MSLIKEWHNGMKHMKLVLNHPYRFESVE
jgi:hypothetical protein